MRWDGSAAPSPSLPNEIPHPTIQPHGGEKACVFPLLLHIKTSDEDVDNYINFARKMICWTKTDPYLTEHWP